MEAVRKLTRMGFTLQIEGNKIQYRYTAPGQPDRDQVQRLLAEVAAHKAEALEYLAKASWLEMAWPGELIEVPPKTTARYVKVIMGSPETKNAAQWKALARKLFKQWLGNKGEDPARACIEGQYAATCARWLDKQKPEDLFIVRNMKYPVQSSTSRSGPASTT